MVLATRHPNRHFLRTCVNNLYNFLPQDAKNWYSGVFGVAESESGNIFSIGPIDFEISINIIDFRYKSIDFAILSDGEIKYVDLGWIGVAESESDITFSIRPIDLEKSINIIDFRYTCNDFAILSDGVIKYVDIG